MNTYNSWEKTVTLSRLLPHRMPGFECGQPLATLGHTSPCTLLPAATGVQKVKVCLFHCGGQGKSHCGERLPYEDLSSSPTVAWRQGLPLQPKQALNYATLLPQPLGLWVIGVRPQPAALCLYSCARWLVCVFFEGVCAALLSSEFLDSWVIQVPVHSGYWSCCMCVTWENLFPF